MPRCTQDSRATQTAKKIKVLWELGLTPTANSAMDSPAGLSLCPDAPHPHPCPVTQCNSHFSFGTKVSVPPKMGKTLQGLISDQWAHHCKHHGTRLPRRLPTLWSVFPAALSVTVWLVLLRSPSPASFPCHLFYTRWLLPSNLTLPSYLAPGYHPYPKVLTQVLTAGRVRISLLLLWQVQGCL